MTTNKIGIMNKVTNLMTPDWKICISQESDTCLVAEDKSNFRGRICKQCFAIKNHKYYLNNKVKLNSDRVKVRRLKRVAERLENALTDDSDGLLEKINKSIENST